LKKNNFWKIKNIYTVYNLFHLTQKIVNSTLGPIISVLEYDLITVWKLLKMATKWGVLSAGIISNDFVSAVRTLPTDEHQVSHNFLFKPYILTKL